MAQRSLDLIKHMRRIAEKLQPITGRGVGYQLFTRKLIASMDDMPKVYRLLVIAREQGHIPWEWIVDETEKLDTPATWEDPEEYARATIHSYRRDRWAQQLVRVLVVSEKGTVRGILLPVLDELGIGFQVIGGFASAKKVYDRAADNDGRELVILYVGDWDPSGMFMSEADLPERLTRYGGEHVTIKRIALEHGDLGGLPSFAAKRTDPRFRWYVERYGKRAWELDAMDPNELRARVCREIESYIDPGPWERCRIVEQAEQQSLIEVMNAWAGK
jgi:hypothetical protein